MLRVLYELLISLLPLGRVAIFILPEAIHPHAQLGRSTTREVFWVRRLAVNHAILLRDFPAHARLTVVLVVAHRHCYSAQLSGV
jgi:hypothetical protein